MRLVTRHPSTLLRTGLPLAALLLAFFLRVYRLADKNVWWDEGWSIWLAQQDWIAIAFRTASDEHPPLHYWMLKAWSAFAVGSSADSEAFAARFLSVAFGVLTVALIYRIGKRLGGVHVGLIAALFLALARFHVWWSQDIKNYTPSIFFAFAAVWFALAIMADGRWRMADGESRSTRYWLSAICYSLFTALALWTHYLTALIVLAVNVYALIVFAAFYISRSPRRWVIGALAHWLIANTLAFALFAPWLYLYLANAAAWSAAPAFDFALFLKLVATVLPLGVTTNIEEYAGLTGGFTFLVLLGCASAFVNSKFKNLNSNPPSQISNFEFRILLFVLIVLLPPLLIYFLSLTPISFFAPKIQARYLLILLPAYAILVALGIAFLARLSRFFASFALLFVLFASLFVLRDYYAERRLTDEYATLANTINAFARQGDAILLDTDQEYPTFLYYLRAPLDSPTNLGISWLGAPNGKAMDAATADALVQRTLARNRAVWLVAIPDALATDPQHLLEARLARELPKRAEWTFDDKRVVLYARDERDLAQVAPANLNIHCTLPSMAFPNAQLIGFDLPVRELRVGDSLRVTTYWNATIARGEVQLVDVGERIARSTLLEIATGKNVRVVTELQIPIDAAGEYAVRVSIAGTSVILSRVFVETRKASARVERIANPTDYRFGEAIRLVGYDLPQTTLKPNDYLPLTLYWRADRAVEKSYVVFVHLLGAQYNAAQNNFLWGQMDRVPQPPTRAWSAQIVTDAYRVQVDAHAPAGAYKIEIGLYDPATGARLPLDDGTDSVIVAEVEIK